MTAEVVAELIKLLEQPGLEVYVDGGWAADALLGQQTRAHQDLDIALPETHVPRLRDLLSGRGFWEKSRNDTWECNFVLVDANGSEVDVHTCTLDRAGNNIHGVAYKSEHLTGETSLMATQSDAFPPSGSSGFIEATHSTKMIITMSALYANALGSPCPINIGNSPSRLRDA
jgi:lincosamide nucleotidyltransferase A/C/D/E